MDVELVLSVIVGISATVLAVVGLKNVQQNKKIIAEMIEQRKYAMMPYLVCGPKSYMENKLAVWSIVVHNQGQGPASNIKISLTVDQNILCGKNEFKEEVDILGPNCTFDLRMWPEFWVGEPKVQAKFDYVDMLEKPLHREQKIQLPRRGDG